MKVFAVIPARYGSTRFMGKPLALINGKALLTWVIQAAKKSKKIKHLIVATDDKRIAELALAEKIQVAMTDSNLATGSDRVWAAIQAEDADVVINIQGDEPLLNPENLDLLAEAFENDPTLEMATLGRELDEEALFSEQTAKIVLNHKQEALYFSRYPIPYSRQKTPLKSTYQRSDSYSACLKHIGLYAYRKDFLKKFCEQAPVELETYEGLEQLRALYLGARIKVIKVESDSWGVDLPEDILKIEKLMRQRK